MGARLSEAQLLEGTLPAERRLQVTSEIVASEVGARQMGIGDVVDIELLGVGFFEKGSDKVTNLRHRTTLKTARTHVK